MAALIRRERAEWILLMTSHGRLRGRQVGEHLLSAYAPIHQLATTKTSDPYAVGPISLPFPVAVTHRPIMANALGRWPTRVGLDAVLAGLARALRRRDGAQLCHQLEIIPHGPVLRDLSVRIARQGDTSWVWGECPFEVLDGAPPSSRPSAERAPGPRYSSRSWPAPAFSAMSATSSTGTGISSGRAKRSEETIRQHYGIAGMPLTVHQPLKCWAQEGTDNRCKRTALLPRLCCALSRGTVRAPSGSLSSASSPAATVLLTVYRPWRDSCIACLPCSPPCSPLGPSPC